MRTLTTDPRISTPALWEMLLRNVSQWDIHQVEFCSLQDHQLRRIRWIDPSLPPGEHCCWSLSVSLPDHDGEICQLRASSTKPIISDGEFSALAALLKTFGAHFAVHSEQLFGPDAGDQEPVAGGSYPDGHRKAA